MALPVVIGYKVLFFSGALKIISLIISVPNNGNIHYLSKAYFLITLGYYEFITSVNISLFQQIFVGSYLTSLYTTRTLLDMFVSSNWISVNIHKGYSI